MSTTAKIDDEPFGNPFGDEFEIPEADPNEIRIEDDRYVNLPAIPGLGRAEAPLRVSVVAKVMDDPHLLTLWKLRQLLIGIKKNPKLLNGITDRMLEEVANHRRVPTSWRTKNKLNQIAAKALDLAGSKDGAEAGTAFHDMMEIIDAGGQIVERRDLADDDRAMILGYQRVCRYNRIKFAPEWIERVVAIPEFNLVGRLDRIGLDDGTPRIMDIKSQATMDFGHISLAVQLACYSHASFMLDQSEGPGRWKWVPMPEIDKDLGVVLWTPSTKPGVAEAFNVDLAAGWDLARESVKILENRKIKTLVLRRPSA